LPHYLQHLPTALAKRWHSRGLLCLGAFFAVSLNLGALADNSADRTAAKSDRGDYKSIVEKDAEESMEDYRRDKERRARENARDLERRRRALERKDERADDDSGDNALGLDALTAGKGSQFDVSTYQDTDFSRHSFIDLLIQNRPDPRNKPLTADDDSAGDELFKKDGHRPDTAGDDSDDPTADKSDRDRKKDEHDKKRHFDEMSQVYKDPVPPGPNNWVPDKLDPLNNGGFEVSPDNGSPVPYRLNGHVDLERGRPWKDSDQ